MYYSDLISLRRITPGIDANGFPTKVPIDILVWANKKSVSRSEFYAANNGGIKVTQVYEVHVEDWGNQIQVIEGEDVYDIVRAYQKGLGIIELNCKAV
ncbi:MAG: hypothetical protein WC047_04410 [Kiritimatiellales bacterium]